MPRGQRKYQVGDDADGQARPLRRCGERWARFRLFLWDPETRLFAGRPAKSWAKIGAFYLAYYSCLLLFCAIHLVVVLQTMPTDHPRWYRSSGKEKANTILAVPGMGMRPSLADHNERFSPTITFSKSDKDSYSSYVESIDNFLKDYENIGNFTPKGEGCSGKGNDCSLDLDDLGECRGSYGSSGADEDYGYGDGKPCVLIKLNKVYNWYPEAYDKDPVNKVRTDDSSGAKLYGYKFSTNSIAVSCQEQDFKSRSEEPPGHVNNIKLYPQTGLPFSCYPYCGGRNYHDRKITDADFYLQPVIMAKFDVEMGETANIWCRAWASNIKQNYRDRAGGVRFSVAVDK